MSVLRTSFLLISYGALSSASAQSITSVSEQACAPGSEAVHVSPLHSDSTCSSFLICIDTEVRMHLHRMHTEHVFVLDGEAIMQLGDQERRVKAGDTIVIPAGTPHGAKVTSKEPLRVVSVQAPRFDGSDRVLIDP